MLRLGGAALEVGGAHDGRRVSFREARLGSLSLKKLRRARVAVADAVSEASRSRP